MRGRLGRRAFVARLVGSAVALGIGGLAAPRAGGVAWAQAIPPSGPISVRLGELVQAGADFRGGQSEGIRLPGMGGDAWALSPDQAGARYTSEPLQIDFPCSHVGVHWRVDEGERGLRVEVRSSRDGQRWTGWRRVHAEARREDETFGALVGGRLGTRLQYRLTFDQAGPETVAVRQVALTYLDARAPAESQVPGPRSRVPAPAFRAQKLDLKLGTWDLGLGRAGPGAFLARVVTREQWGADESIRFVGDKDQWPRAFVEPKFLVVHHTAGENVYDDPAAEVRAIYTYHTVTQGWGDIGYQLLIDNRGQVYEGRIGRGADQPDREIVSRDVVAGHVFGYNYGSVGISLLGNFMDADPSESAVQTLEEALAFEAARHGIDPTTQISFLRARRRAGEDDLWRDALNAVSGHRDCIPTECPGDRLHARLPEIRQRVAARIGPSGPGARIVRGPDDRNVWPTDLVFAWEGTDGATQFSTRLEGWRLSTEPDRIVPLSGYTPDERPEWSAWSSERAASFPLAPDASGHYTLHVRARGSGGEGTYADRWPLFVDRHVVADNRDPNRAARQGAWRRTSDILGFNAADYEQAEPAGAPAGFAWTLEVPESGTYRVLACWTEGELRATNARFTVSAGGQQLATAEVSQREQGAAWVELARVPLTAGTPCRVELTNAADGVVVADAVRLVLV